MAKLHVITYGCQMNEYDSERVADLLREHRYELTDSEGDADLILVNTCAIREKAEDKVFSKLGELRALKARKPELVLGVMGCMAQLQQGAVQKRAPYVDLVFGSAAVSRVAELVDRARRERGHARRPQGLRVVPPAAAVGQQPRARADEPRLHARAVPGADRGSPGGGAGARALDGPHRRLPGRDRGGLPRNARDGRARRLRQRLRLPLLAAAGHPCRRPARPDPRGREGRPQSPPPRGRGPRDARARGAAGGAGGGGAGGRRLAAECRRALGPDALQPCREPRRPRPGPRGRRRPRPGDRGAPAQPAGRAPVGTRGGRMLVEMKVRGLALDPVSNMPIIILRDEDDKRSLPIWVGIFEANAIALELEKIPTPRPMTHDLIKNILESLEVQVLKIVVTDLKDNTFFAVLHLKLGETEYTVDSRPSDAIALALRVAAPIFVEEEVFPKAGKMEVAKETTEPVKTDDPEQLREWLQNIKPEDFEKYNKA